MPIRNPLFASSLALALAACATPAASDGAASAPPADAGTAGCNADAVQSAIGQQATPERVEQARKDAGATTVRTLKPDQVVTMEYLEGRLNVLVDDNNNVTGARCG